LLNPSAHGLQLAMRPARGPKIQIGERYEVWMNRRRSERFRAVVRIAKERIDELGKNNTICNWNTRAPQGPPGGPALMQQTI
jgi:hypothetical protein